MPHSQLRRGAKTTTLKRASGWFGCAASHATFVVRMAEQPQADGVASAAPERSLRQEPQADGVASAAPAAEETEAGARKQGSCPAD
eukprot:COSAG01_NODE_6713_length_3531_cov_18.112762_4_plen_86_part_00